MIKVKSVGGALTDILAKNNNTGNQIIKVLAALSVSRRAGVRGYLIGVSCINISAKKDIARVGI